MNSKREDLPSRRYGWTQKVRLSGQKLYLTCNQYPDGRPGEIFVVVAKTGELVQAMLSGWAMEFSALLQHGVTLDELHQSFRNTKFDPSGPVVGDEDVQLASSLFDYVVKHLKAVYAEGKPTLAERVAAYSSAPPTPPVTLPVEGESPNEKTPVQSHTPSSLRKLCQEMADKWQEPVLLIEKPPETRESQPRIPYGTLASLATEKEKAAAVETIQPQKR